MKIRQGAGTGSRDAVVTQGRVIEILDLHAESGAHPAMRSAAGGIARAELGEPERQQLMALGADLACVWPCTCCAATVRKDKLDQQEQVK